MVDIPYMDQWGGLVPLLEKFYQGTLSFDDLWNQHNAHRMFFPLIIMITLAHFSAWRISYELATNILLGIGIFLILVYQLRKTDKEVNHRSFYLIPVVSLITFSLCQWENWLWGWQMQIFLNVLAVVSGVILLANHGMKWLYFCLALLLGVIGTYSFANGLLYWPIGLFVLFFIRHQNKRSKMLKIILWIAVSLIVFEAFFYEYKKIPGQTPIFIGTEHHFEFIKYIFVYLGALLCHYQIGVAMLFGVLGLIMSAFIILFLIRGSRVKFHVLIPYVALSFYSIGSAVITAFGRAGLGCVQGLSSRYVTISSLFWISNIVLLCLLANVKKPFSHGRMIWTRYITSIVIVIMIVLIIINSVMAFRYIRAFQNWLLPVRNELFSGRSDELVRRLHPNPRKTKERIKVLKKYKLSVFRENGD